MDPELVKAIREYLVKSKRLADQGVSITPEQSEEFFRVRTSSKYGFTDAQKVIGGINTDQLNPANLARSGAQGALFNFGDEAVGLVGGEGAKEEMRLKDEMYKRANPKTAAAAEIGGALAVPGVAGAKILGRGAGIGRAMLEGAAIGGASGGLAGAGAAEGGLMERAGKAALPAAVGAGLGMIIPGGAGMAGLAFNSGKRALSRIESAIGRVGGPQAVEARAQAAAAAGRGGEVMLGDMGKPLQQATDFAANNSEEAADAISKIALPRQHDAAERILKDVRGAVGDPQADEIVKGLAEGTRAWARGPGGYGGLGEANPTLDPQAVMELEGLLASPAVSRAWEQAAEVGLIGPKPPAGPVSFEVLQGTKERLDAAADAAFNRGMGDLGSRLGDARDAFVQQMRSAIPGYEHVARQYAERKGMERAVEAGVEAFTAADSRGLQSQVSKMSKDELELFRKGMASSFITQLRSASTNKQLANQLANASPRMQDKLEVVFGSEKTFKEFLGKMEVERDMAEALKALGGSATARRQAAVADPASVAIDAATGGPMGAAVGAGRSIIPKVLAGKTARDMAPMLTTQGSDAIMRLMQQWHHQPPLISNYLRATAPMGAGSMGGLLGEQ